MTCENTYARLLQAFCTAVRLDTFNEPYELMNRRDITLDTVFSDAIVVENLDSNNDDIRQNLVRQIDKKIELLEAQERNEDTSAKPGGFRGVLYAPPGGGKSTLCKRLALALIRKEDNILEKYRILLPNARCATPILVQCKTLHALPATELSRLDIPHLLYILSRQMLGEAFDGVQEQDFCSMVARKAKEGTLYVMLDAWDEVLNEAAEKQMLTLLQSFLDEYPDAHVLFTVRDKFQYENSTFLPFSYQTEMFTIAKMGDGEIFRFAKNWYRVMFLNPENRHVTFFEEMRKPYYLEFMRTLEMTPLNLARILSIYHRDGCLPINKIQLFQKYVDNMLFWYSWKKTKTRILSDTIQILLAYLAFHLQSSNRLDMDRQEAQAVIRNCLEDLDGYFAEEMSPEKAEDYLEELVRTSIFEVSMNRNYGFSHRQLQEYFAAVAIRNRWRSSPESPAEILETRCLANEWEEVCLFAVGMDQEMASYLISLMVRQKEPNDGHNELLFRILSSNIGMSRRKKEQAYDHLFSNQITDRNIRRIVTLLSASTIGAKEFKEYIAKKYRESFDEGDTAYGYAQAVISSVEACRRRKNPLEYAEELLLSGSEYDRILGTQILTTIGWCKQVNVHVRPITDGDLIMSEKALEAIRQMLQGERFQKVVMTCLKDCILAEFCFPSDCISDVASYAKQLEAGDEHVEELLFAAPAVWTPMVKQEVLERYRDRLACQIEEKKEEAVFTLGVCAAIGCFPDRAAYWQMLARVNELFPERLRRSNSQEERRIMQLRGKGSRRFQWSVADDHYQAIVDMGILQENERSSLESSVSAGLCTNLSYLLRRGAGMRVLRNGLPIGLDELLLPGLQMQDPFAVMNKALQIAGTCRECAGDMERGLAYLRQSAVNLEKTASWWFQLALEKEAEGVVVLAWLHALNQISFSDFRGLFMVEDLATIMQAKQDSPLLAQLVKELRGHIEKDIADLSSLMKNLPGFEKM